MQCAEFEALLLDALDGTIAASESAPFEAHREVCLACAQLLEEARRGSEWLRFLEPQPEAPADLVTRILAQTSGVPVGGAVAGLVPQAALAGMPAVAVQTGWLPGLERHAAQSRWMMTAAMAFFSIAFTMNLTGVRLTGLKLSDLTPGALASGVTRQFYAVDAHVMRYYDSLRFVYELESRVREIKQTVAPVDSGGAAPGGNAPAGNGSPASTKPKKDGSARRSLPEDAIPDEAHPVLASLRRESFEGSATHPTFGRMGHPDRHPDRLCAKYPGLTQGRLA